jgi:glycosyltransferase involved in cell wall biosynthesis
MRILWVKAGKLLPLNTGGRIRSYNILKHLASHNEVTLLSYYGGERDHDYEAEIDQQLPGTLSIYTGQPDTSTLRGLIDYLRRLPSPAPYAVSKFTSRAVQEIVERWINEQRFQVAVCDFLSASRNFPSSLATPTVLFQHNVESILWERQNRREKNLVKRIAYQIEAKKMRRYERLALEKFHHILAVSENDRFEMSAMTDSSRISVVPTGVDLSSYKAAGGDPSTTPVVTFLGSMDWEPNIDGVLYFCREIWPSVQASVPEAEFRIVGRNPHPKINALANDSIKLIGSVPSVVEYLSDTTVFVVPLRIGGGTRLKILEAMAMGKATVSTSIGAEGLDVNDGSDILIADTSSSFAESITDLLTNRHLRKSLEAAAARKAAQYDWSVVSARFEEILRSVAGESARSSQRVVTATVPMNL